MRRVDVGSDHNPRVAGDPLRLELRLPEFGIAGAVSYACFPMLGVLPASTPTFVLGVGNGITVTSPTGGCFSVQLPGLCTALWTGRDWHEASMVDVIGQPVALFGGVVVSTRGLAF